MALDPLLATLAQRYGLGVDFARRLAPLVARARAATPDVRRRLIELVESSFEREARRLAEVRRRREQQEDEALRRVARLLHAWRPPAWFEAWSRKRGA